MTRRKRTTSSGKRGRPPRYMEYLEANLRATINAIHTELGGHATVATIYQVAITRGVFPPAKLASFAQRAASEYIRGALAEIDPQTGVHRSQPILLDGERDPVWVQLPLMDVEQFKQVLDDRRKQFAADYSEYRRLWEYGAARFGQDRLPSMPEVTGLDGPA